MTPGSSIGGRRAAFTLVELMVVLVIISIITSVVVAEMGGSFQDALLRSCTRQMVSICNAAYGRAVATGHAHRVALDLETGRYVIERRRRGHEFVPVENTADAKGQIDPRIRVDVRVQGESLTPPGDITFYADGTADDCQVKLTDRAGDTRFLRIDPVTSRVEVGEQASESENAAEETP
jgi:type II secretion system protein H